jgi:hypothetical protein
VPKLETLRAKIGATILDVFRPGWAHEIDLDSLNLADCHACVLGQTFGDYNGGAEKLFAMRAEGEDPAGSVAVQRAAYEAGFVAEPADLLKRGEKRLSYSNLTKAWKREVARRQA